MPLVRVYCGLASADPSGPSVDVDSWLTAAVVDDAGRLLDVCHVSDDPAGYASLSALLTERASSSSAVAIAADSDDHLVTALLITAGQALAFADDDAADDFAERFADDESADEMESPPAERRAVGLARALQAGALSATTLPASRDLAGLKPVLAAHGAISTGRHAAAMALREVLRELYPAALRAFPDPAEPVALAVMHSLPEPSLLGSAASGRARDTASATDAVVAELTRAGVAPSQTITQAVTALRVAIAETPRRGSAGKAFTATVAETVRQAVTAVQACDAAADTLISAITERVAAPVPVPASKRTTVRRPATAAAPAPPAAPLRPVRDPVSAPPARATTSRRGRAQPVPTNNLPAAPQPVAAKSAAAPQPVAPPPMAPPPVAPLPSRPVAPPANQPVSAPPPPPGITPIAPAATRQGGAPPRSGTPADAGQPFRPTITAAAMQSARRAMSGERDQPDAGHRPLIAGPAGVDAPLSPAPASPAPVSGGGRPRHGGVDVPRDDTRWGHDNRRLAPEPGLPRRAAPSPLAGERTTIPAPRPSIDQPAPGSRYEWPTDPPIDEWAATVPTAPPPAPPAPSMATSSTAGSPLPASTLPVSPGGPGRVTPPWLADDLQPPEPPALRLVEPTLPAELRDELGFEDLSRLDPPPLRLVDTAGEDYLSGSLIPQSAPPVGADNDGDLLIFAAARSAWFTGQSDEESSTWQSPMDVGWRAAEEAAKPTTGQQTGAGLPRRVPQANLVPGSAPLTQPRQLRIVRDAAAIAAHTSGYFRGWRRGQEVGGFAVGGRGRESAGAWDFSREEDRDYRSASGYHN